MSHFAKVENGIVVNVIVAEQDVIDSGIFGHGWVQTSYNTMAVNTQRVDLCVRTTLALATPMTQAVMRLFLRNHTHHG
jgi:hypothetical protein